MKISYQLTVKPWEPPKGVYTEEGVKLPISALDKGQKAKMCRDWLEAVLGEDGFDFNVR